MYKKLRKAQATGRKYNSLSNLFYSDGYNSDAYDKIMADKALYTKKVQLTLKMAKENSENFLVMKDCAVESLLSSELFWLKEDYDDISQSDVDKLLESYKENYIVVNKNYFNNYMDIKEVNLDNLDSNTVTLLVPKKFQNEEKQLR